MKNFLLAARPKTLLAGIIPPSVAYTYYLSQNQPPQWIYFALCFFGALFIQLATNFFNDVIDHEKGADKKRVGPTRVSSSGLVKIELVRRWAWACVLLALSCGIPIVFRGGWPFIVLGLISLYLTYGYTGGTISLAYRGLGEIFVFLFFGLFSVMGSYYLYALDIDLKVGILSCIFGLLATTFIGINNLRDRETDTEAGKKTLATRMSPESYQWFIIFTIFLPYLLLPLVLNFKLLPIMIFSLIPALKLTRITRNEKGAALNEGLKFSGIHLIIFSLLLCVALIYGYLL